MTDLQTQIESSTSDDVRAVLQRHFELMRATSPAESCHVMDPDAVLEADVVIVGGTPRRTVVGRGWIEGDWA